MLDKKYISVGLVKSNAVIRVNKKTTIHSGEVKSVEKTEEIKKLISEGILKVV